MTLLESEIREQPEALRRLLAAQGERIAELGARLRAHAFDYAVVAARGSSDNAARYAQYALGARLGLPVALAAPSLETMYGAPTVPRRARALVLGISQSGRSPDVVSVLESARSAGAATVAITNDPSSPLAGAADDVVVLGLDEERSVAATKTYTASLAAVAALVAELRDDDGDRAALAALPDAVDAAVEAAFATVGAVDRLAGFSYLVAVGRGFNYATALEVALKVRELTGRVAEGFSPADLMHGPIAAVAPGTPALILALGGPVLPSVLDAAAALRSRGAEPLVLGDVPDADLPVAGGAPEWLTPVTAVIPGQVAALRLATLAGRAIDAPPGLTKVTRTL